MTVHKVTGFVVNPDRIRESERIVKRYEVRPCKVSSDRALDGYAHNFWYIHDNETDEKSMLPTIDRRRTFRTRRKATAALMKQNESVVQS